MNRFIRVFFLAALAATAAAPAARASTVQELNAVAQMLRPLLAEVGATLDYESLSFQGSTSVPLAGLGRFPGARFRSALKAGEWAVGLTLIAFQARTDHGMVAGATSFLLFPCGDCDATSFEHAYDRPTRLILDVSRRNEPQLLVLLMNPGEPGARPDQLAAPSFHRNLWPVP